MGFFFLGNSHPEIQEGVQVKIKKGVPVFQDFCFYDWPEEGADIVFVVASASADGRVRLVADGFGVVGGDYGNGAVYTAKKNVRRA